MPESNEGSASGQYPLPPALAHHAGGESFVVPGELRAACREAGEGLGREDAALGVFRSAAEMVALWRGLDLPAWEAPYVLRDARLGYLNGYGAALVAGDLPGEHIARAAEARWGEGWQEKLEAALGRSGG
ncbi:MAG: hypothetical protein H0X23_02095 [Rubrobacter sp.]|nr:hypothetical protein [Rubrobacter sp.]